MRHPTLYTGGKPMASRNSMICRLSSGGKDWITSGARFCNCSNNSFCSWSNVPKISSATP
jgi:hypothetical protein